MVLATALLLAWVLTAFWIALAPGLGLGKRVRAEGPEAHLAKAGTPSMGGVAFLLAAALAYGLHGGTPSGGFGSSASASPSSGRWTTWREAA